MYQFLLLFVGEHGAAVPVVVQSRCAAEAFGLGETIEESIGREFVDMVNLGQIIAPFRRTDAARFEPHLVICDHCN